MSTPFLVHFSANLVRALVDTRRVEIADGRADAVAFALAHHLAAARERSLVAEVMRGLLACPDVDEVFVTDDELKELIQDLGPRAARGA